MNKHRNLNDADAKLMAYQIKSFMVGLNPMTEPAVNEKIYEQLCTDVLEYDGRGKLFKFIADRYIHRLQDTGLDVSLIRARYLSCRLDQPRMVMCAMDVAVTNLDIKTESK